jgi:hypothetical protein
VGFYDVWEIQLVNPRQTLLSKRLTKTVFISLLIVSAGVRLPGLFARSIWYDEAITLLETAGYARPTWPREPEAAWTAQRQFQNTTTLSKIYRDLRQSDIHPPVYYWLLIFWRRGLGFSLEAARGFSLVCSVASILGFYLLLHEAKIKSPLIPALVYALTSASIHFGHEARAYALASLLLMGGALFAYLACGAAVQNRRRLTAYTLMASILCGFAFEANYLALFPAGVILLWLLICLWPASRFHAGLALVIAVSIWLPAAHLLSTQLGARPEQAVGFVGLLAELKTILQMNVEVIYSPTYAWAGLRYGAVATFGALAVITVTQLVRRWREVPVKLLILLSGLALAPSAGVFLLNVLFNKSLHLPRYVMFAGPFMVVLLTYGLTTLASSKRALQVSIVTIVLGLQVTGINWGLERTPGQGGSNMRSLAAHIGRFQPRPHIVVIGKETADDVGAVGSLVYELDPQSLIVTFDEATDLESLLLSIKGYDKVWLVFCYRFSRGSPSDAQNRLLKRLRQSGGYVEVYPTLESRNLLVSHLRVSKDVTPDPQSDLLPNRY